MACIFCNIAAGQIPAEVIVRRPRATAFLDVSPLADGHVLIVPHAHVARVEELAPEDAAALFRVVSELAGPVREALGAAGTTIGINDGEATGQTIDHVHAHIVPRWNGDGAGSIHSIFPSPRRTQREIAEVGKLIRDRLGPGAPEPQPESPEKLAALQEILDRSARSATPALARSLGAPTRQMTATELLEFLRTTRLLAMTTVGPKGQPHVAPVHARLDGATLRLVIYVDTVRRADLAANPRVAFTSWDAKGAAAILYGRASEVAGSERDARPAQDGTARRVVEIAVALTRIHAMRSPA